MRNLWLAPLLGTECLFGLALSQAAPKLYSWPAESVRVKTSSSSLPEILFYGTLHRPIHDDDSYAAKTHVGFLYGNGKSPKTIT